MKKLALILITLFSNSAFASNTCMDNDLVIAATGDTIFHGALLVQAFKKDSTGGFDRLWNEVTPYLQQTDLMYTNLEGPVAEGLFQDGTEDMSLSEIYHPTNGMYSVGEAGRSYTFNFHPESVRALVRSGFSLFSTANNHSLDRKVKGLNKTLDFLYKNNIDYFGTRYKDQSDDDFVKIINKNNMNIAFIGCTYGSNVKSKSNQVMYCYEGKKANHILINLVKKYSQQVGAVIVTPHWGTEYAETFNSKQKNFAKALVAAGAKAIIGHHPHVVQPVEYLVSPKGVKVPVLYSLGNFVTNQAPSNWKDPVKNESRFKRRVGAVAFIGFNFENNEVQFNNLKVMPTYMKIQYEGEKGMRKLVPAYKEKYPNKKKLAKSLDKSMKYFSAKFNGEVLTYNELNSGVVCKP